MLAKESKVLKICYVWELDIDAGESGGANKVCAKNIDKTASKIQKKPIKYILPALGVYSSVFIVLFT